MMRRFVIAVAAMTTPAALHGASRGEGTSLTLENRNLRVEFSARDGAVTRLTNKRRSIELISVATTGTHPWAMLLAPWKLVSGFMTFSGSMSRNDGDSLVQLRWETTHRIVVKAQAKLARNSDELELTCSAENAGDQTILALRYPAMEGIGTLSVGGLGDRLLHSTMMGAVFSDPFHLFRGKAPIPAGRGLVVSRYPNGFGGSALQLMAYYSEGQGGFCFTARDPNADDKDLNFYKAADDRSLVCEFAHIQRDARPGKSLTVEYPVIVSAMTEGSWYEAAERYRAWAVCQPWCRRGSRLQRIATGDGCRWLWEEIGAVGMWWPFRDDIRADVLRTRRLYNAPLLHLELWWRHGPSHEAAQRDGDRFGPFYFPFLALKSRETFKARKADAIVPLAAPITPDWVAMCPAQPGWRKVVCESAEDMASAHPLRHHQIWVDENYTGCHADCLYYDIGPCAGVPTHCYALGHAHPPGAGREITRAYVSLFEESQRGASQVRGTYVPVGTECVAEPFVGCLDLYYARNAALGLDMETFPYVRDLTWLPDGRMEVVPLFPFVYHEYGPVAVQGIYPVYPWGLAEAEDYFAWAEARAVLWGGLIVSFPLAASPPVTDARAAFLRGLTAARRGFARRFLAYGRMQRPPVVCCGTISIDHGLGEGGWLRRIRFAQPNPERRAVPTADKTMIRDKQRPNELAVEEWAKGLVAIPATVAQSRRLAVPSVLCQAYTCPDALGILLVNLRAASEEIIHLLVEPRRYGLPEGVYELRQAGVSGSTRLDEFSGKHEVKLKLPPRAIVLVSATRKN